MSKHNKAKIDKAKRNEYISEKFQSYDKQAKRQARRLRVKLRDAQLEQDFWTKERQRRDWPEGHSKAL